MKGYILILVVLAIVSGSAFAGETNLMTPDLQGEQAKSLVVPAQKPARHHHIEKGLNGARYFVLDKTGARFRLVDRPLNKNVIGYLPLKNLPLLSLGTGVGDPCAIRTITSTGYAPPYHDLQIQKNGYLTPVKNQASRGTCGFFASVATLEMEYVAEWRKANPNGTANYKTAQDYANSLSLSEEYLIQLTDSAAVMGTMAEGPQSGGSAIGHLEVLSPSCNQQPFMGLPLSKHWSYRSQNAFTIYQMMLPVPLVRTFGEVLPGHVEIFPLVNKDTNDVMNYLNPWNIQNPPPPSNGVVTDPLVGNWPPNVVPVGLRRDLHTDLASYSWSNLGDQDSTAAVYPPPAVHELAKYAPLNVMRFNYYNAQIVATNSDGTPIVDDKGNYRPAQKPPGCTLGGNQVESLWDYQAVVPILDQATGYQSAMPAEQKQCLESLAAPFEKILSENHPIAIVFDICDSQVDTFHFPPGGLFKNNDITAYYLPPNLKYPFPNVGCHFVTLIGYDRARHLFHFKNSGGLDGGTDTETGAKDGTFWTTYDLFLRSVGEAVYIDGVWDAGADDPAPIPNGIWFGFWQGTLNGVSGVAVIDGYVNQTWDASGYYVTVGSVPICQGGPGNPAGTFYGSDGSETPFFMTGWQYNPASGKKKASYTATFAEPMFGAVPIPPKPLFSLTKTVGSPLPQALFLPAGSTASGDSPVHWLKCSSKNSGFNVLPKTFLEALDDPYVLPPCDTSIAWHQPPPIWRNPSPSALPSDPQMPSPPNIQDSAKFWTCPNGGEYVEYVDYDVVDAGGNLLYQTVQRGCVVVFATPNCPWGYTFCKDCWNTGTWLLGADCENDNLDGYCSNNVLPLWLDGCQRSVKGKTAFASPTCPGLPVSVFGITMARVNLGSFSGQFSKPSDGGSFVRYTYPGVDVAKPSNVFVRPDLDGCVSSVYAPTLVCPSGYVPTPNGNDCILGGNVPVLHETLPQIPK